LKIFTDKQSTPQEKMAVTWRCRWLCYLVDYG